MIIRYVSFNSNYTMGYVGFGTPSTLNSFDEYEKDIFYENCKYVKCIRL